MSKTSDKEEKPIELFSDSKNVQEQRGKRNSALSVLNALLILGGMILFLSLVSLILIQRNRK